jgi:hypothetical protein
LHPEASAAIELDEAATRKLIDRQLRDAGWEVDSETLTFERGVRPTKGKNLAIAEWPTLGLGCSAWQISWQISNGEARAWAPRISRVGRFAGFSASMNPNHSFRPHLRSQIDEDPSAYAPRGYAAVAIAAMVRHQGRPSEGATNGASGPLGPSHDLDLSSAETRAALRGVDAGGRRVSTANVDPVLERIGDGVLRDAADIVLRVHRASGFPLFLVRWPHLPPDDAIAWWTTSDLAVVRVAGVTNDERILRRRVGARLAVLDQHAAGLPLRALTNDETTLRLSESCVTTAALIRAATLGPAVADAMPDGATTFIDALAVGLARQDHGGLALPPPRLAALLVAAGLRGGFAASDEPALYRKWNGLSGVVDSIRRSAPIAAANAAWKWATRKHSVPRWSTPRLRNVAVRAPRVRALGAMASGVLASDDHNAKGFPFTPHLLNQLAEFTRQRPLMYLDHDRSRPPAIVALDAAYHCHKPEEGKGKAELDEMYGCHGKEGHHVSILVAARSDEGAARLEAGGGFSVGVDLVPARKT